MYFRPQAASADLQSVLRFNGTDCKSAQARKALYHELSEIEISVRN